MNILLIGNICSGKSTVTKEMIKQIGHPTFTYAIDKIRNEIGNGKFSGEFKAWSHFLMKLEDYSDKSIYTDNRNGIFECSGTGRNCWYVVEPYLNDLKILGYKIRGWKRNQVEIQWMNP
jgi:hypothetical protein